MNYKYIKRVIGITALVFYSFVVRAQLDPVTVGEKIPPELVKHIHKLIAESRYFNNSGKPVLIDFWATWCMPCVASLPAIDSLQRANFDKFTILSILEQSDKRVPEVVNRIFGKKGSKLTFVNQDNLLKNSFPHQSIPHYVWINQQGIVKAITEDERAITLNVAKLLSEDKDLQIETKVSKINYNGTTPMFASKQAAVGDELVYHSMISKWRPDLATESARGNNFINCINSSMLWLYQIAFGGFNLQYLDGNRVVLEGFQTKIDSAEIGIFTTDTLKKLWRKSKTNHLYSYELMVPDSSYSKDQLFEIMQQDINRYFKTKGFNGHLGKKKAKVISLDFIAQHKSTAFASTRETPGNYTSDTFLKMINQPISFFLSKLAPYLKANLLPLYNSTGYKGIVNIDVSDVSSMETINNSLAKYGLKLEEKYEDLDILVLQKIAK